jgi:hypothetical protein
MRAIVVTPFFLSGTIPEFTRNFRVRDEDILPFPRQSTPLRLEFTHFRANFSAIRHSPPST